MPQNLRRIIILTEAMSNERYAKTAISVIRYCSDEVIAALDSHEIGKTTQEVLGVGGQIPFIAQLNEAKKPSHLLIGIATPGGKMPESWRVIIREALKIGLDIISGLHQFLSEDEEFVKLAHENNCRLQDIRKNNFKQVATRKNINKSCYRVHTVGHDCAIGKMVTSLEINSALQKEGHDSTFVATGQTGIMITGKGLPVDCIIGDFLNGAGEELVRQFQDHDIVLIEGQGALLQPLYSPVTLGLLHGCMPDALVFCYSTRRKTFKNTNISIPSLSEYIKLYESIASANHPCKVVGIAMNSQGETEEFYKKEKARVEKECQLPVTDVIRENSNVLCQTLLAHKKSIGK